jgi:hypothetical protein
MGKPISSIVDKHYKIGFENPKKMMSYFLLHTSDQIVLFFILRFQLLKIFLRDINPRGLIPKASIFPYFPPSLVLSTVAR